MRKTLYICYFGVREPLVQTQVIAYLRRLAAGGIKVFLLTFEPDPAKNWTAAEIAEQKGKLASEGIQWDFLPYHKSPSVPATMFDVFNGARYARKMVRREKIDVLHCRSHVPAMMGALAKKFFSHPVKMIFDIRGFLPEEYTDAGNWKENGKLYHAVKKVERRLLRAADGFVVLTEKARGILFPESRETGLDKNGRPVEVIPCCVDLERFAAANDENKARVIRELNLEGRFVVAYIGSFGGWYMAEETAGFFKAAKEYNGRTFAMILTQSDPEMIRPLLADGGFSDDDFFIKKVSPSEIPRYLSAADLALSFIKPCYSKLSSSPTKIAEYLASGVPVVSNKGIGDVDELIVEDRVGVLINDFTGESYLQALKELERLRQDENFAARCRQSAEKRFDLKKVGGVKYLRLYKKLLGFDE